jgi:flagellar motor switch protein FliG
MSLVLANRQKAAAVLVALGPERATSLLRSLDANAVSELAAEVAAIGTLAPQDASTLLRDVAQEIVGRRMAATGGPVYAKELLERVLGPERAGELSGSLGGPNRRPFAWLAAAEPAVAARALLAEPPATVALAVAHLEPEAAARILVDLPGDVRGDVATRVASLERVHPDVLAEVDEDLERRLRPILEERTQRIEGLSVLVGILNQGTRETEKEVLESIELTDPDLAARIRDALFIFDDIGRLDDRAIQQLLKSVESRDLAVAMKGAGESVSACILRNLSERARENLVEEIEFLKGLRPGEIEEARTRIVRAVRTLEEAGTITIERG